MNSLHAGFRTLMAVIIVSAGLTAGCGQKDAAPPPDSAAPQAAQPATAQPPAAVPAQPAPIAAPAEPASTTSAQPAAQAGPPTAAFVAEHETGVEVTLVELKRTAGDSVTAKWRYRNTQAADVKILKGGSAWSEPYKLTMGAFLIDPINKKKYMVITDAENIPLASKHGDWQGYTLAPGQALSVWARFPAPPADVDKVTVTLPGVPPFEDVPVVK